MSLGSVAQSVGRGWRTFFWVACAFNLVIGALGMVAPGASVDERVIGLLVFCFGIIYVLVARDPHRFAPALWAGVIGKFGVVALLAPGAFAEGGDRLLAGILVGDALFALGFLAFLMTRKA
ncbi:MAG: hypothetical protein ACX930_09845 [Erythrobacter sp.]